MLVLLCGLIVLPVGVLIAGSFLAEPPRALHIDWSGLTLAELPGSVPDRRIRPASRRHHCAALVGTAGATVIGTALAWLAVRTDVPGRRTLDVVAVTPMFVPPLIGAFAWDILASPPAAAF
ncbi:MAG: hypothetical protein WDN49_21350 [Acetobacteraceae bacterium]